MLLSLKFIKDLDHSQGPNPFLEAKVAAGELGMSTGPEELHYLVRAGLTPYEAIRAGTYDAADFLHALDDFGTVAVGRRADLILAEGNPLQDVANINRRVGVMVRGRWLPQSELQTMLEEIEAK